MPLPCRARTLLTTCLAMLLMLAGGLTTAVPAGADTFDDLSWSAPRTIDPQDGDFPNVLQSLECPSAGLCLTSDDAGYVLSSTQPFADNGAWNRVRIDTGTIVGVSCPTTTFCAAASSNEGFLFTTTDPTGPASAWKRRSLPGTLRGVTCASPALCVAFDTSGQVFTSTQPTGDSADWTPAVVDSGGRSLYLLECPTTTSCIGFDDGGRAISSVNPAGGAGAWKAKQLAPEGVQFAAASCPSANDCSVATTLGDVYSSANPTAANASWTSAAVQPAAGLSCLATGFCVLVTTDGKAWSHSSGTSFWSTDEVRHWPGAPADELLTGPFLCLTDQQCLLGDQLGRLVVAKMRAPVLRSAPVVEIRESPEAAGVQIASCSTAWDNHPTSGVIAWIRDGAAFPEAGSDTDYVLRPSDRGHDLSCAVTASNSAGSASAASAAVRVPGDLVIVPPAPGPTGPAGTPAPQPTPPAAPASIVPKLTVVASIKASKLRKGLVVIVTGAKAKSAYSGSVSLGKKRLASIKGKGDAAGRISVRVRFSKSALKRVKGKKTLKLKIKVVAPNGTSRTFSQSVKVK